MMVPPSAMRRSGRPRGRAVYQDRAEEASPMLRARTLRLRGRPDLLIAEGGTIIPVEIKTGRTPREPYHGHVLQLLAYCLLVEEHHGVRPPYGLIRYPEREFRIAYDDRRERELRALVATVAREKARAAEQHRSHAAPPRCAACGFRAHCDERLDR
jgi:CRISPR-associated exonuclease Cas4